MGYDASCTLTIDGKSARGTAWLEQKDLVFRGPVRLSIPLSKITSAVADDGCLRVRFGERIAEFEIGEAAKKWAHRIQNPPSRLDKLGVKRGMNVFLLGAIEDAFPEELEARGATVVRRAAASPRGDADVIFYLASRRAALERVAELTSHLKPDGALWIVRPKGKREITEADTMIAGRHAGLVDVKVVSFSDALTAEKFMIPVPKRGPRPRPSPSPRKRGFPSSRARS
jgi:hypothetical protein